MTAPGTLRPRDAESDEPEDIVDAEFEELIDESGEVPIPEDLADDAGLDVTGDAACYPLPDELVQSRFALVPVTTIPQPVSIAQRIVVPFTESASDDSLHATLDDLIREFPLRVASLRQARFRLISTQERLRGLLVNQEEERRNINWRNNAHNARIETELKTLRDDWQREREDLQQKVRDAEAERLKIRNEWQEKRETARAVYWGTREKAAAERDAEAQTRAVEDRKREAAQQTASEIEAKAARERADEWAEKERALGFARGEKLAAWEQARRDELAIRHDAEADDAAKTDAARREELKRHQKARAAILDAEAAAAEDAARAASDELATIEAGIARQYAGRIDDAEKALAEALADATRQLSAQEAALRELAELAEAELLVRRQARRDECDALQAKLAQTAKARTDAAHQARRDAAGARADAETLMERADALDEDVIAPQTDTAHLAFPEPSRFGKFVKPAINFVAHIGLGGIFGVSLGILTGAVEGLDAEGLAHTSMIAAALVVLVGVFVFAMIGKLTTAATAFAAEELHAVRRGGWRGRFPIAAFLAFAVIVGTIAIEAYVERHGIVAGVAERLAANGAEMKGDNDTTYWMIALIVSVPFVLWHAYEGFCETRYRLGERERVEALAQRRDAERRNDAESTRKRAENLVEVATAQASEAVDAAELDAANSALAAVDDLLQNHVAIVRHGTFLAERETTLASDPAVRTAARFVAEARDAMEGDIVLRQAREQARARQNDADNARSSARALIDEIFAPAPVANRFANVGSNVADALGTALGQVVESSGTAAGAAIERFAQSATDTIAAPANLAGEAVGVARAFAENAGRYMKPPVASRETYAEMTARQRWYSMRAAIKNDPRIAFFTQRIESLKTAIRSADARYGKQKRHLLDKKRAVELRRLDDDGAKRFGDALRAAREEAELDARAAQLAFDEEWELLQRLYETPRFLRVFELYRQRWFVQSATRRRLEAARQFVPAIPAASTGPATPSLRAIEGGAGPAESSKRTAA